MEGLSDRVVRMESVMEGEEEAGGRRGGGRGTYYKLQAAFIAVIHVPMTPTLITILLIQTCGSSLLMIRLLGQSKRT